MVPGWHSPVQVVRRVGGLSLSSSCPHKKVSLSKTMTSLCECVCTLMNEKKIVKHFGYKHLGFTPYLTFEVSVGVSLRPWSFPNFNHENILVQGAGKTKWKMLIVKQLVGDEVVKYLSRKKKWTEKWWKCEKLKTVRVTWSNFKNE